MSHNPNFRSVGLIHGYINKLSDDCDHPHKHLGQAMVGDGDITDGRVIVLTRDSDGALAITNFRKHDGHMLQDFTVEHITNPHDHTWKDLNSNLDFAIHPGAHGYADDSNLMVLDHNIPRAQRAQTKQHWEQRMTAPVTTNEDNFLINAKFTNNDTKASEVRTLVQETIDNQLAGDNVVSARLLLATELEDGSVHISHLSTSHNQTRSELNTYMFTNGGQMYSNMCAGFDRAIEAIEGTNAQALISQG